MVVILFSTTGLWYAMNLATEGWYAVPVFLVRPRRVYCQTTLKSGDFAFMARKQYISIWPIEHVLH